MQLSRLTSCAVFEINAPMWRGKASERMVGLNLQRVKKHNEIKFTYRRKSDGELSIPDTYYFDGDMLNQVDYERQNRKGVTLVLIPFSHLSVLERV